MDPYPTLLCRKALAARLITWQALLDLEAAHPGKVEFASQAVSRQLDDLVASLTAAPDPTTNSPGSVTLQAFVDHVRTRLVAGAPDHFLNDAARFIPELDAGLARRARESGCDACRTAAKLATGEICRGGVTTDDKAVRLGGQCLREIDELCAICLDLTSSAYLACGGLAPHQVPQIQFGLRILEKGEASLFGHYFANGSAERPAADRVAVMLVLGHEGFNRRSYLALFMIVMHELVAHAFANSAGNDYATAVAPSGCGFAEGWMDGVAHFLIERLAAGEYPYRSANRQGLRHFRARVDEANAYHLLRHAVRPGADPDAIARSTGRGIALRMLSFLRRGIANPEEIFLRFSLTLNAADLPWQIKSNLAAKLGSFLPEEEGVPPENQDRFYELVKQYVEDQDIVRFSAEVMVLDPD